MAKQLLKDRSGSIALGQETACNCVLGARRAKFGLPIGLKRQDFQAAQLATPFLLKPPKRSMQHMAHLSFQIVSQ